MSCNGPHNSLPPPLSLAAAPLPTHIQTQTSTHTPKTDHRSFSKATWFLKRGKDAQWDRPRGGESTRTQESCTAWDRFCSLFFFYGRFGSCAGRLQVNNCEEECWDNIKTSRGFVLHQHPFDFTHTHILVSTANSGPKRHCSLFFFFRMVVVRIIREPSSSVLCCVCLYVISRFL